MRVLMLSGDPSEAISGCGLYRLLLPAQQLRAHGWDVTVTNRYPGKLRERPDGLRECYHIKPVDGYDVVVFQRPSGFTVSSMIPLFAEQTTVVVELDDDLERTSPDNAAYVGVNPTDSPGENWLHLKRSCYAADLLTVSTPALTRYGGPVTARVLPNCVPASLLRYQRGFSWEDGRPRVGWSGQVSTHPHDLQTTRGGVAQALTDTGASLHIVGDQWRVRENLNLADNTVVTQSGWVPISEYPNALTAIDIGIVPLESTAFTDAKSFLKGMEFAALGIPFVASPTPEYRRLHDEYGIGLLASRPRDWRRLLGRLINDEGYRRQLGEDWRAKVGANLTYETNGWRWVRAYEEAATIGARRRGVLTTAGR